jgi:hypothetical protein
LWFVDGEAVNAATPAEAAVRRSQHATAGCAVPRDKRCVAVRCEAREREENDGCGVVVCGEQ